MKLLTNIFCISFLLVNLNCFADQITCYSGGKKIYHANIKDVLYSEDNENVIWVKEKNKRAVFLYNLNCVADITEGEKKLNREN